MSNPGSLTLSMMTPAQVKQWSTLIRAHGIHNLATRRKLASYILMGQNHVEVFLERYRDEALARAV